MQVRQRARYNGQLVTILEVHGRSKRAKVKIRDGYGFTETVRAKDLEVIPLREPGGVLRF